MGRVAKVVRDPRELAPEGSYLTDGQRLVFVVESDYAGVLAENALTDENGTSIAYVTIEPIDLMQKWRRVRPQ